MSKCIFLDMDGVLADFTAAALRVHGATLPYHEIRWDFDKQIGVPPEKFWAPFGFEFWRSLDPTPEFHDLIRLVDTLDPEAVIVSSPCDTPGCVEGKREWLARWLPKWYQERRYFFGAAKHRLAGSNKLLVDDHEPHAERFQAAGGVAVLVPRPWNSMYTEPHAPLASRIVSSWEWLK